MHGRAHGVPGSAMPPSPSERSALTVFLAFLRMGLISFGGPVAHIGYFRDEFVQRRRWLSDGTYAELVALCQFLPGPASSQVGIAVGLRRAGYAGAVAAFVGFTLPSAALMVIFAWGIGAGGGLPPGLLHGLKLAAVAVVAHAVFGMAQRLAPDLPRAAIAVAGALAALLLPGVLAAIGPIALGIAAGVALHLGKSEPPAAGDDAPASRVSRRAGLVALALFLVLLVMLPVLAATTVSRSVDLVDGFYRAGALVFGGGHVVLPLLEAATVAPGWLPETTFLAGYGAAQAVPGPLFSFAAFLGAAMNQPPTGIAGATLCLAAIYLPSFLLVFAALPFWERLRASPAARSAVAGANAAVVGLLAAALYDPVGRAAVMGWLDLALAAAGFLLLVLRVPAWLLVAVAAAVGLLLPIP